MFILLGDHLPLQGNLVKSCLHCMEHSLLSGLLHMLHLTQITAQVQQNNWLYQGQCRATCKYPFWKQQYIHRRSPLAQNRSAEASNSWGRKVVELQARKNHSWEVEIDCFNHFWFSMKNVETDLWTNECLTSARTRSVYSGDAAPKQHLGNMKCANCANKFPLTTNILHSAGPIEPTPKLQLQQGPDWSCVDNPLVSPWTRRQTTAIQSIQVQSK